MHIHRTDLNLLAIFECVYSHGSVTRAAEVLHLTQPSVSHALARLRERVSDPLFVRQGKKLVPTAAARKLIHPIRESLQLMESSLADMEGFDPATATYSFTIGMRPLLEGALLPSLMRQVAQQAPNVALSSVQFDRPNLETELTSGNIHTAVDVFLALSDSISRQHLSSARIVVVARQDHPAIHSGRIDLDAYLSQKHVLVSSRPQGDGVEDLMLARQGLRRSVVARCQQIGTGLELVCQSDLLMTVSESLVNHLHNPARHQICIAPFQTPEVDTYLYWHSGSEADRASQWLRNQIIEAYRKSEQ